MTPAQDIISLISQEQNPEDYHKLHWAGDFTVYLDIVRQRPEVARTAFQGLAAREAWDRQLGLGLGKLLEVRRDYNDIGFIETFLTEEFCREQQLFTYAHNQRTGQYEIAGRDFGEVKRQLLFSLTNFGHPFIYVADANDGNRGELLLTHRYEGVGLRMDYAGATLQNLRRIWGRPVHLETEEDGQRVVLSCEDEEVERQVVQSRAA